MSSASDRLRKRIEAAKKVESNTVISSETTKGFDEPVKVTPAALKAEKKDTLPFDKINDREITQKNSNKKLGKNIYTSINISEITMKQLEELARIGGYKTRMACIKAITQYKKM